MQQIKNVSPVNGKNSNDGEFAKTRPMIIVGNRVIKLTYPGKLSQRPVCKFLNPCKPLM